MNKNVIAVLAAVGGLFMASCDTPKDQRPSSKASVDYVEPGTRSTFNVSDAGSAEVTEDGVVQDRVVNEEVMPNHDAGANTIQPGDSIDEAAETNSPAGAVKPSTEKP